MSTDTAPPSFTELGLSEGLLKALIEVGYETPSPIQAATIPPLMEGRDVLGQAQTGTGKTAAFALPTLSNIDPKINKTQVLVLAPTRELAIQVSEAFHKYAKHLPGFNVVPIYGGQSYTPQLNALKRGAHVVVGTPGRVIDHLNKGSLDLSALKALVLDEADEMLRMGFIDDVEEVLKKTPDGRQVALFSATMPAQIRRIAQTYLREPVEVTIKSTTTTSANINQRYWAVSGVHKLDALTRILEAEPFDGMIIFSRTKIGTEELAEKLSARGIAAAAINGDMDQKARERTIQRLKDGNIDVLVATDVAARGLDVERISHVLNYDIPYDTESYVHRIGRTGRAGRKGDAILFVTPREKGMLRAIERATRQTIEPMALPTVAAVNERRVEKFFEKVTSALESEGAQKLKEMLEQFERERNIPMSEIAAALAHLVQGKKPLLLDAREEAASAKGFSSDHPERASRKERFGNDGDRPERKPRAPRNEGPIDDVPMETFRIDVGHAHMVKPGNIVGAIANEAEIDARHIGRVDIRNDYSLVDLPKGMPDELLAYMKKVRVGGRPIQLRLATDDDINAPSFRPRKGKPEGGFGQREGGYPPRGPKKFGGGGKFGGGKKY